MSKNEYVAEVLRIVDEAATNRKLSTEDYADILDEIISDLQMKYDAVQNDLKNKKG